MSTTGGNTEVRLARGSPHAGDPRQGFLAGMRVRKKLLVLHTAFTAVLAGIMLVALRPAVKNVVARAELEQARQILRAMAPALMGSAVESPPVDAPNVYVRRGSEGGLGITPDVSASARVRAGEPVEADLPDFGPCVVAFVPGAPGGDFIAVQARIPEARRAVWRLYALATLSLVAVYVLVALALEVFVLPRNVYRPIARLLDADRAVQEGRGDRELIPDPDIPADEMGEIMRSRNRTVSSLRQKESALADALTRLEEAATDLKRKNHMLEMARRNLADADRLASLGMMSAGIAHELNTPLAVLKGLVEKLNGIYGPANGEPPTLSPAEAALMLRVVGRLEKLGEGLLDFARARRPSAAPVGVRAIVDEAATLLRFDRDTGSLKVSNRVGESVTAECDGGRMVQVFVNLLRNAADAGAARRAGDPRRPIHATIRAEEFVREGRAWVSITVEDDGPGIDPAILPHLFEPFASTRLDSRGTGLGLAVSEGIVREHGGVILARNRADAPGVTGAAFEVVIPQVPQASDAPPDARAEAGGGTVSA